MIASRRRAFLGALAAGGVALWSVDSLAMGRTPLGGVLTFRVPYALGTIDPHDLRDPAAALFGAAIADPIYARDAKGRVYPALARALPAQESPGVVVRLRAGLRTAGGRGLDARDVIASFERSRARGGAAVLGGLPVPRKHPGDALAVIFPKASAAAVGRALSSPVTALLPRSFEAGAPDGTGAFAADCRPGRLVLTRNERAARGPAFLERVVVERASDLKDSLRAFEAERDDLGWLGQGLFRDRPGSVRFDFGAAAFVVLASGDEAGAFGAPGVTQRLCDGISPSSLAHLGLGGLAGGGGGSSSWGGKPGALLVDESSAHLVEIARAVAASLDRPGHELTVEPISRGELSRRRVRRDFALALDLARIVGPTPLETYFSLATADDAQRAREAGLHPAQIAAGTSPRRLTSALRVGVLGELRISGGRIADAALAPVEGSPGWDWGASHRRRAGG